jgi:hypothetical protein
VIMVRAELASEAGKPAEAVTLFEQAIPLLERSGDAFNLLVARVNLAENLWKANLDRTRARTLMQEAHAALKARGEGGAKLAAYTETWLSKHR